VDGRMIVLVTGGFDPIHNGHIRYLKSASMLGNALVVGLNSDRWLVRKKGIHWLDIEERIEVLESIRCVDQVITFNDDDNTANKAIYHLLDKQKQDIVFANGGDRNKDNIYEYMEFKNHPRVSFAFDIGGEKINNSSSYRR
tara:strand:+ start:123 stop:545 length:423 start_codon:yes stop_codon:yes gene_type:complete